MNLRQLPNMITIIRALLLIPIVITLLEEKYQIAFIVFSIAGISDGLDGFLARRFHWTSKFGALADPIADKLLMLISYSCLAWLERIPLWLFIIVIARDIWIALGAIAYRILISEFEFKPTRVSKINTFFQIFLIAWILFQAAFIQLSSVITETLIYIVLITTVSSLIDYTWDWGRRALENMRLRSL